MWRLCSSILWAFPLRYPSWPCPIFASVGNHFWWPEGMGDGRGRRKCRHSSQCSLDARSPAQAHIAGMSFVPLIRELCIRSKGIDPFDQANWQRKISAWMETVDLGDGLLGWSSDLPDTLVVHFENHPLKWCVYRPVYHLNSVYSIPVYGIVSI